VRDITTGMLGYLLLCRHTGGLGENSGHNAGIFQKIDMDCQYMEEIW
jgi:hypothetical protein